jgi:copper(I)-binding protein
MRSFESVRWKAEAVRVLGAAAWLVLWNAAAAAEHLSVTGVWVAEAPPGVQVMAGYLRIANEGPGSALLVGVASPDFERVELHRTEVKEGVARMVHESELPIPAHGVAVFEPGAQHLMLIGPRRALKRGDRVTLTLSFADGTVLRLPAEVRPALAASHDHAHEGAH